eukprot:2062130-Amphidinium_carterae.1
MLEHQAPNTPGTVRLTDNACTHQQCLNTKHTRHCTAFTDNACTHQNGREVPDVSTVYAISYSDCPHLRTRSASSSWVLTSVWQKSDQKVERG